MCPVYQEYSRILNKISRDETLWPHHRFVGQYLKDRIDKKHLNRCVKYEVQNISPATPHNILL